MKRKLVVLGALTLAMMFSSSELHAEDHEDNKVCFYQLNEEGECELICVDDDELGIMPCSNCTPDCWL